MEEDICLTYSLACNTINSSCLITLLGLTEVDTEVLKISGAAFEDRLLHYIFQIWNGYVLKTNSVVYKKGYAPS